MATKLGDNISYGGKKPNFERDQFASLAEAQQYSGDLLDEGHISYMVAEQKHYKWNGTEWESFASSNKEWIGTQAEYDALETIDNNTTYYITE